MSKVSVVIPSRCEQFLPHTVADIFAKSTGDVEVIAVLEDYWPVPILPDDPRLTLIHFSEPRGMRGAINAAVSIAHGDYILKTDAHCMFAEGFDETLAADCDDDWVVIPRRHRLDAENWCLQDVGKPPIDYEYLSFPDDPNDFGGPGLNGRVWTERILARLDKPEYEIDENMSAQGSAWFMKRDYFYRLELMDEEHYGTFWNEMQELGFKSWLSGGKVIVNKKTWYAHLHKGRKYGRGYHLDSNQLTKGATFTKKWITNSAWDKQTLPFEWLIDRFSPIPGWPTNWRELLHYE